MKEKTIQTGKSNNKLLLPIVLLVLSLFIPLMTGNYMLRVLNVTLITYLCVLSVYVLLGLCGQNSFAQAGLWGVGAYATANFLIKFNVPPLLTILFSTILTALFAFVLGFAFFRLREYYFTFASVGLMTILNGLFMNWEPVTGGALGIQNIPPFSIGSITFQTESSYFYLIMAFSVLAYIAVQRLYRSALGRSLMAIRDNEIAANCMGVNSLLTKSIAFGISGALCGLAGALYAFLSGYLSYQTFTYQQSTMYLIMIMLGGTASPKGPLIGTLIISLLQELVRPLANYMQLIYGAGIMALMIFQPEGITGGGKSFYEWFKEKRRARTHTL